MIYPYLFFGLIGFLVFGGIAFAVTEFLIAMMITYSIFGWSEEKEKTIKTLRRIPPIIACLGFIVFAPLGATFELYTPPEPITSGVHDDFHGGRVSVGDDRCGAFERGEMVYLETGALVYCELSRRNSRGFILPCVSISLCQENGKIDVLGMAAPTRQCSFSANNRRIKKEQIPDCAL